METLYEQVGESPAIEGVVYFFYQRMLGDPRVSHHFVTTDIAAQRCKMGSFLAKASGKDVDWQKVDLHKSHKFLQLTEEDFAICMDHLNSTLDQLGIVGELKKEVMAIMESTKHDILALAVH